MTTTASKNPAQRPANRRRATIAASAALATVITGANLPATFGATAPIRNVAGTTCVDAGYRTVPTLANLTNMAPGPTCYWNPDQKAQSIATLAPVNSSLTKAQLTTTENTSPLSGKLARDSFAAKKLTGTEAVVANSSEISRTFLEYTGDAGNHPVTTAINAGTVKKDRAQTVGGHENIPTLAVNSANPHQEYVEVVSRDGRVNANAENKRILTGGAPIPKWLAEDHGLSGDQSVALYDEATGIWRSYFKFVKDADAQTYTSTARVQVGGGNVSTPKSAKIQYDNVGRGNAGQTVTINAPVSIDAKSGNARTSYPIARGAKFRLAKNVPGASIDANTGVITYKIPAGTRGTVDIPVAVDYPATYHVSSGGYMLAKPNFGGVGEDNYWLTLKNGTSSVVGLANEITQIGVDELKAGKINHMVSITAADYAALTSSFPAKGTDGKLDMSKYPNAPRAGQRGFLPANFDVEEHLRNTGHAEDELSRMILTAMKEYGFIIADRNLFTNAFNLEAASSYAPYARQGKNVYKEDPQLAAMFANFVPSGFTGNQFPWQQVQWMPVNYTESAENSAGRNTARADTSVKFKYPSDSYGKTGTGSGVIYQPAEHHATVYSGETAVAQSVHQSHKVSPNYRYARDYNFQEIEQTPNFRPSRWVNKEKVNTAGGQFSSAETGIRFASNGKTGTYSIDLNTHDVTGTTWDLRRDNGTNITVNRTDKAPARMSDVKAKKGSAAQLYSIPLKVHVVDKNSPIAREDSVSLYSGTTQNVAVLNNDEASFGAYSRGETVKKLELLNQRGQVVSAYSDEYGTYRVVTLPDGTQGIAVSAKNKQGFAPLVRYRAVTDKGVKSAEGYLQVAVANR
ncbi:MAG: selenocysteine lyase [Rothia sp.]|uniref:Rib/alpha-like domain-containing protein n=1 Tax=Rothia sp. (in: high G+C Gram-positive bacteria) TaxID=1885016 RepID=UPI001CAFAA24|nr:Rib/alpha-like domain-containing protein [Rothia sp. (in: high G+C Gram-positive bacteria)]MBF1680124.1 selenocysteine lyase [Rothia sp. (in: high G+C Gram-positive bacteria)]